MDLDALQLKVFRKRMHRAISPDEVVLFNRRQKLGPLWKRACYGVEHKARVERRDERNIDVESWRILNLRYLKAVHLLALFVGGKVDLAHAVAIRQTLKNS